MLGWRGRREQGTARWRTRQRVVVGVALVLLAALLALWLARKPVATRFIDRELARRGVPARYRISDLGFGRQRLTDVVIGDPSNPDLVADWIETDTAVGLTGARLTGVRAGHVRLRARVVDGRLTMGSVDRLIPQSGAGEGARLPVLDLHLDDGRIALDTPAGAVTLALSGEGSLFDGFRGRVLARAPGLRSGGCRADDVRLAGAVTTHDGVPTLNGPLAARRLDCGNSTVASPRLALALSFGAALDRLDGRVGLQSGAVRLADGHARGLTGSVSGRGTIKRWSGRVALSGDGIVASPGSADRVSATAGLDVIGRRFLLSGDPARVAGAATPLVELRGASLAPHWRRVVAKGLAGADATPLQPMARRLSVALDRAGQRFDARVGLDIDTQAADAPAIVLRSVIARSASGARLLSDQSVRLSAFPWWRMPAGQGRITFTGGGLPDMQIRTSPGGAARGLRATLVVQPYAADRARLALGTVYMAADDSGWTVNGRAQLSGPFDGGFVDGLDVPLSLRGRGDTITLNGGCTPIGWRRIAAGGLVLSPATLGICPDGAALVSVSGGRVEGGARVSSAQLSGRIGDTPLTLQWQGARLALAARRFALTNVAARLGSAARITRIDAAELNGRIGAGGVQGSFGGGAGQVGAVPLTLSGADGSWRFGKGALALNGAMTVSDAAAPARFQPLSARNVALTLVNGAIHATGTLHEPQTQARVADVAIDHTLSSGAGDATLRVAGITFSPALQPDRLTRLTFGVVADVRGTVSGEGHIAWNADGVASSGDFGTDGLDLAAAFGPVKGLASHIHFTDLLALQSAPGQQASVASINPGVPVENGVVRFQTLAAARVRVEGARWPFAGGTLTLEPTLLDFGSAGERRMTFTIAGVSADQFLQQFDFKNLEATGVFDGTLPMVFDETGGRIENGRLTVRQGGGSIAYLGEVSRRDLGFWGNLAFGALRSLRYRDLGITMNGPLAGEMVTDVRFSGISQGKGAISNFLIRRLQRLPFVFNVRIKAPFRGLIDSAQSFYDPSRLVQRNLPQLIEQQNRAAGTTPDGAQPVQPVESGHVPSQQRDGK